VVGIEVKYNEIKNRLEIENFTGETPIAIKQDFYATIYLSNMVALAKMDANAIINEKNKSKNLKYEYKVNTNILVGKLKNSLVSMLLEKNSRKRSITEGLLGLHRIRYYLKYCIFIKSKWCILQF
jgi:hypothetical protein